MALNLSYTQKEILNLIQVVKSEDELNEIKSLLIAYFSDKVTREADSAFEKKDYPLEVFEKWKHDHFRKSA